MVAKVRNLQQFNKVTMSATQVGEIRTAVWKSTSVAVKVRSNGQKFVSRIVFISSQRSLTTIP